MSLCSDVDFVFYIYYHFFSLDRDSTCSGSASSSPTSPYRGHCATSSPTPPIWWDGGSSTSFRTTTRGQQNGGMFVTYKLQRSLFSILHFGIAQNQLVYPPPPPPVCLSVVFNVSWAWVLQLSQEKLKEIILIPHRVLFLRPRVCINCCFANASFFAGGGGGCVGGGATECIK